MQAITTNIVQMQSVTDASGLVQVESATMLDPQAQHEKTMILADCSYMEAVATSLVLKMLLTSRLAHNPDLIPHVVMGNEMPSGLQTILIVCTDGAFQQRHMLKVLMVAGTLRAKYIPILASDSFRFPTKEFLEENQMAIESVTTSTAALAQLVCDVFKSIAVVFAPQAYSSTGQVLAAKADAIAKRCASQTLLKELVLGGFDLRLRCV